MVEEVKNIDIHHTYSPIQPDNSESIDHHYVFLSGHLANLQVPLPSLELLHKKGCLTEEDFKKLELALDEALANAVDHGNLELDSKLREEFDDQGRDCFSKLREERLLDNRFASRFVFINVKANSSRVEVSVKDEGRGFNTTASQTAIVETEHELPQCSGRGLILIKAASDEVSFNDSGNEVVFMKRFKV